VPEPLDVAVTLSADKSILTSRWSTRTKEARSVPFDLRRATLEGPTRRFVLTGRDRWAHNVRGQPEGVTIREKSLSGAGAEVELPPLGVALYRFTLR
jgi:hypothetical protein